MSLERKFLRWRFFWTMALLTALCLTEAAPHVEANIRAYTVSEPGTLSVSGNVSAGIISGSWNNPPVAGWPLNVVAATLAVPFAAISDSRKWRG
jgi:hypothetical protein